MHNTAQMHPQYFRAMGKQTMYTGKSVKCFPAIHRMFTVITSGLSFPGSNGAHYRNILDEGNRQKRGENSHEILFFDGVP